MGRSGLQMGLKYVVEKLEYFVKGFEYFVKGFEYFVGLECFVLTVDGL